jgi:hypothetical protein
MMKYVILDGECVEESENVTFGCKEHNIDGETEFSDQKCKICQ